ncbi:MAG: hypothetical protein EA397_15445, partial [Deltaproteobacteria bacterium]
MGTQCGGKLSLTRAAFLKLETSGKSSRQALQEDGTEAFYVQFNPTELKLKESAKWENTTEDPFPDIKFQGKDPSKLSMELIFDTTDTGESVDSTWVKHLRAYVSPTQEVGTEEDDERKISRPPFVQFLWGQDAENGVSFKGVVEKLDVTYIMFSADGKPIRAKVSVDMLGIDVSKDEAASKEASEYIVGSMFDKVVVVTAKIRDTPQSIADEHGADPKAIAEANNKPDVTSEFEAGEKVIVTDLETALEISAELKTEVEVSVTETITLETFVSLDLEANLDMALGSAFDEDMLDDLGVDVTAAEPNLVDSDEPDGAGDGAADDDSDDDGGDDSDDDEGGDDDSDDDGGDDSDDDEGGDDDSDDDGG